MNAKAKGTRRERDYKPRAAKAGWWQLRSPGSLGPVDQVLIKRGRAVVLQTKANEGSPWKNFQPHERHSLSLIARQLGCPAYLLHWRNNRPPKLIPESQWPGTVHRLP